MIRKRKKICVKVIGPDDDIDSEGILNEKVARNSIDKFIGKMKGVVCEMISQVRNQVIFHFYHPDRKDFVRMSEFSNNSHNSEELIIKYNVLFDLYSAIPGRITKPDIFDKHMGIGLTNGERGVPEELISDFMKIKKKDRNFGTSFPKTISFVGSGIAFDSSFIKNLLENSLSVSNREFGTVFYDEITGCNLVSCVGVDKLVKSRLRSSQYPKKTGHPLVFDKKSMGKLEELSESIVDNHLSRKKIGIKETFGTKSFDKPLDDIGLLGKPKAKFNEKRRSGRFDYFSKNLAEKMMKEKNQVTRRKKEVLPHPPKNFLSNSGFAKRPSGSRPSSIILNPKPKTSYAVKNQKLLKEKNEIGSGKKEAPPRPCPRIFPSNSGFAKRSSGNRSSSLRLKHKPKANLSTSQLCFQIPGGSKKPGIQRPPSRVLSSPDLKKRRGSGFRKKNAPPPPTFSPPPIPSHKSYKTEISKRPGFCTGEGIPLPDFPRTVDIETQLEEVLRRSDIVVFVLGASCLSEYEKNEDREKMMNVVCWISELNKNIIFAINNFEFWITDILEKRNIIEGIRKGFSGEFRRNFEDIYCRVVLNQMRRINKYFKFGFPIVFVQNEEKSSKISHFFTNELLIDMIRVYGTGNVNSKMCFDLRKSLFEIFEKEKRIPIGVVRFYHRKTEKKKNSKSKSFLNFSMFAGLVVSLDLLVGGSVTMGALMLAGAEAITSLQTSKRSIIGDVNISSASSISKRGTDYLVSSKLASFAFDFCPYGRLVLSTFGNDNISMLLNEKETGHELYLNLVNFEKVSIVEGKEYNSYFKHKENVGYFRDTLILKTEDIKTLNHRESLCSVEVIMRGSKVVSIVDAFVLREVENDNISMLLNEKETGHELYLNLVNFEKVSIVEGKEYNSYFKHKENVGYFRDTLILKTEDIKTLNHRESLCSVEVIMRGSKVVSIVDAFVLREDPGSENEIMEVDGKTRKQVKEVIKQENISKEFEKIQKNCDFYGWKNNFGTFIYFGQFNQENSGKKKMTEITGIGFLFSLQKNRLNLLYHGSFKNGKKEGNGKEYLKSGKIYYSRYEGSFVNDLREGKGFIFELVKKRNIVVFEGLFKNGLKNGKGESSDIKKCLWEKGIWKDNILVEKLSAFECPIIPYSNIKKLIDIDNILGDGGYGIVYKVKTSLIESLSSKKKREEFVAVKLMKKDLEISDNEVFKLVKGGIELCSRIKNPYLLKTIAIIKGDERIGSIMEYCVSSVSQLFQKNKLDDKTKRRYLLETAKGILSLHKEDLMHRDLKWGNILISEDNVIKLTDFDTVKDAESFRFYTAENTSERGTIGFMAPEVIQGRKYNLSCDVYSFAIMIYSLFLELGNPFCLLEGKTCEICRKVIKMEQTLNVHITECKTRPLIDDKVKEKIPSDLISLMKKCWDADSKNRLKFEEIVDILEE